MTIERARLRTLWQVGLLTAGFIILVAVSVSSLYLSNRARTDALWVTHTVEVESQISTVQLQLQRAESAMRGYLLSHEDNYLNDFARADALMAPSFARLEALTRDNPYEQEKVSELRSLTNQRLEQLRSVGERIKSGAAGEARSLLLETAAGDTTDRMRDISRDMRIEENRLFAQRTEASERTRFLSAVVTASGSALVVLLAILSIVLLRASTRARDEAQQELRDINLNLESTIDDRTTDLREANQEIQRFAYIVSHDLRSPLVNIMGFTSELEELRGDIFNRIARYSRAAAAAPPESVPDSTSSDEPVLPPEDQQLSEDFSEALGFIKSSIGKMDRLISAILKLTREGRREFNPVMVDMRALVQEIVNATAHQATEAQAEISIDPLPNLVSDRLALEQIFSNLIENALKYLRNGVPGEITIRGRTKLGFVVYDITDNGRGIDPNDHDRIFDLFRRAGTQDKPGQGIGLAHVRALVRRLGGSITVSSELDKGSTFTITLPSKWNLSRQGKSYG